MAELIFVIGGAHQGKTTYVKHEYAGYEIMDANHIQVEQQLCAGKNPKEEMKRLIDDIKASDRKVVIISDEVGSGVIPIEEKLRDFREAVGEVNQMIAAEANHVIRVVAGIGIVIK